jgi:hypothetical protein
MTEHKNRRGEDRKTERRQDGEGQAGKERTEERARLQKEEKGRRGQCWIGQERQ